MMYFIGGEDFPVELLSEDEARTVLAGLQDQAAATTSGDRALVAQIHEVSAWLDVLADEAAADASAEAAADPRRRHLR